MTRATRLTNSRKGLQSAGVWALGRGVRERRDGGEVPSARLPAGECGRWRIVQRATGGKGGGRKPPGVGGLLRDEGKNKAVWPCLRSVSECIVHPLCRSFVTGEVGCEP